MTDTWVNNFIDAAGCVSGVSCLVLQEQENPMNLNIYNTLMAWI